MDTRLKVGTVVLAMILISIGIVIFMLVSAIRGRFVDIESTQQVSQVIKEKFLWLNAENLSPSQRQKLVDTVADLLVVYRTGDAQQFMRYLNERKGRLDTQKLATVRQLPVFFVRQIAPPPNASPDDMREYELARNLVDKVSSQFPQWPPKSDEDVFRAYWMLHYHEAGAMNRIAPKTAYIRIFQVDQPLDPELAASSIRTGSASASVFTRLTSFPGETNRPCLYAEVKITAQHPTRDPQWAYYFWLRWDAKVHNWFLDLAGMNYSGMRTHNTELVF
ncbi:MAG: hypothetical protein ACP5RN_07725 [Armatimonadota bacterium]